MDAELRQQPAADEGADYADGDIADQAEAAAGNDFSSQPPGNEADEQDDGVSFDPIDTSRLPPSKCEVDKAEFLSAISQCGGATLVPLPNSAINEENLCGASAHTRKLGLISRL